MMHTSPTTKTAPAFRVHSSLFIISHDLDPRLAGSRLPPESWRNHANPLFCLGDEPEEWNLKDQRGAMAAIFRERRNQSVSFLDMEDDSGVSVCSAFNWLNGERSPILPNFVALAQTFGFEVVMRSKLEPDEWYDVSNLTRAMQAIDVPRRQMSLTTKAFRELTCVAVNSFYAWYRRDRDPTLRKFVQLIEPLGFELVMTRNVSSAMHHA